MPDNSTSGARGDVAYSDDRMPVGLIFAGITTVFAVIFILQNLTDVEPQFLFVSVTVPLAVVIVVSMGLGAVVGWFVGLMMRRRKRNNAKTS